MALIEHPHMLSASLAAAERLGPAVRAAAHPLAFGGGHGLVLAHTARRHGCVRRGARRAKGGHARSLRAQGRQDPAGRAHERLRPPAA
eukprot:1360193-Prymnesium_polylepis.1